eukprot:4995226-Prymnesium_polylepis.1
MSAHQGEDHVAASHAHPRSFARAAGRIPPCGAHAAHVGQRRDVGSDLLARIPPAQERQWQQRRRRRHAHGRVPPAGLEGRGGAAAHTRRDQLRA